VLHLRAWKVFGSLMFDYFGYGSRDAAVFRDCAVLSAYRTIPVDQYALEEQVMLFQRH
jgi:hypothetical protein